MRVLVALLVIALPLLSPAASAGTDANFTLVPGQTAEFTLEAKGQKVALELRLNVGSATSIHIDGPGACADRTVSGGAGIGDAGIMTLQCGKVAAGKHLVSLSFPNGGGKGYLRAHGATWR